MVEDGDAAILIELDRPEHVDFGNRVEVAGFPTRRDHGVILENAIVVARRDAVRVIPKDIGPKRQERWFYHRKWTAG